MSDAGSVSSLTDYNDQLVLKHGLLPYQTHKMNSKVHTVLYKHLDGTCVVLLTGGMNILLVLLYRVMYLLSIHPWCIYPSLIHLSFLDASIHPWCIYPFLMHLSILDASIHSWCIYPSLIHLSILDTSIHLWYIYPSLIHLSILDTSIHSWYIYPSLIHLFILGASIHHPTDREVGCSQ